MEFITGNFMTVFIVLSFIAVVLMLEGLYLFWSAYKSPEAKKIDLRLRALAAGATGGRESSILKQRLLADAPALQRALQGMPRMRELERMLEQSGLGMSVGRLMFVVLCAGAGFFVVALALNQPLLLCLAVAVAGGALPILYVRRKRAQRIDTIGRQLPDALDLICRALRAGHAFGTSLQMVSEEMTGPIAEEFRITHDEINFGVSLQQALTNLASRVPSTDLRYFVVAVLIQHDSGGNLTEVLGNLSALIRERFKLFQKIQVLSAEGRLSAWILGILPFAVAAAINVINPSFMRILWTDPLGLKLVMAMFVMMFVGVLVMRKIIRIHV